jgi:hypothetical protein
MFGNEAEGTAGSINLASYRLARNADAMIHSEIRALYSYWDRLRGGRPCPERAEVDPRGMAGDARHLFVLEDLGDGNIRFRLAGTALHDAFGFDLRGMSARSIMEGRARDSFVALIEETLAEVGVGYARLLAPDARTVWEVVLLPLRGITGGVDRMIGCLHPVSGRVPPVGPVPLRFTIESMKIQTVDTAATGPGPDAPLAAGFAEPAAGFTGPERNGLTTIPGGLDEGRPSGGARPNLRVVRDED